MRNDDYLPVPRPVSSNQVVRRSAGSPVRLAEEAALFVVRVNTRINIREITTEFDATQYLRERGHGR